METLRAARPLSVGNVTLIAIERTGIHSAMDDEGYWLSGFKQAYAIVICDASGVHALDANLAEIKVEGLMQEVSNLGNLLAAL